MDRLPTHHSRSVYRRETAVPAGQEGYKTLYRPHKQPGGRHHILFPGVTPEIRRDAAGHLDRHPSAGLPGSSGKIRRQCLQHTDHTRHHLGSGPPLHGPAPAILGAAVGRPCAENDAGSQADDLGSDLDRRPGNSPEQCRGRHQCVMGHAGHRRYRLRPGGAGYREEYLRRVHHLHGQALRHRRHDQRERLRRDGGRRGHAQYANHGLRPAHHQLSELQNYGRLDRQHLVGTDAPRHG